MHFIEFLISKGYIHYRKVYNKTKKQWEIYYN